MASKAPSASRSFIWIILILVMLGLGGYGATNFGRARASIGAVGDTEIDAGQYARAITANLRAFQSQTGQNLTIAQAQTLGLTQQALSQVIAAAAFDEEARRIGLSVGDERLRAEILSIQAFQDPVSGSFSRDQYENALRSAGMNVKEFEASLRADLTRSLFRQALNSGISTPESFSDALYGYMRETRDFNWARLDLAALKEPPEAPDEAALAAWYESRPEAYTLPEIKHLTYIWLTPEAMAARLEVDEADLRALYDSYPERYNQPERRLVERLAFASEAEARAAMEAIEAGESSFDELVAERGFTLDDVDLGDKTESALGEAGPAIFAMEAPGVIGPLPSLVGPALFRMNAILSAQHVPFEEAREELRRELAGEAARNAIAELIPELDDQLAGGATLEELADSVAGMELGSLAWEPSASEGIAAYEKFREAAAGMGEGDFPELDVLADGGIFAMRVDRIDPPRLQTLEEVRDEVAAAVAHDRQMKALEEQARALLPELESGSESLSTLGLAEVVEEGRSRSDAIEGTPPDMLERVFEMEAGQWALIPDRDGVIIVHLAAVTPPDQQGGEALAIKAAIAGQVARDIGLDLESAFAAALQEQAGITLNQAVINAVHSQFP